MWAKEQAVIYAKNEIKKLRNTDFWMWIDGGGYVHFKFKKDDKCHRFHRFITQERLNRIFERYESVHHIDHDKLNNTPNNLIVMTRKEHMQCHSTKAVRADDKRFLFREIRKGEGNPNYGNRYKLKPLTREQIQTMRHNQPNYFHIDEDVLIDAINEHRRPSLVCRFLNISYKIFMNRCKEYGFGYKCIDNGLLPIISHKGKS